MEGSLERTAMSRHELERATVMGRVKNRDLKLSDAAVMLDGQLSPGKKNCGGDIASWAAKG